MIEDVHIVVLAAGLSRRFGDRNKLLANLGGEPLAQRSSRLMSRLPNDQRIAVVPAACEELKTLYRDTGWSVVQNDNPERGQSSSIRIGTEEAFKNSANTIIFSLADMPFVTDSHLRKISEALQDNDAVMSEFSGTTLPPSGFARTTFDKLLSLSGDKGAKSIFLETKKRTLISLSGEAAIDVDTADDLQCLEQTGVLHGA